MTGSGHGDVAARMTPSTRDRRVAYNRAALPADATGRFTSRVVSPGAGRVADDVDRRVGSSGTRQRASVETLEAPPGPARATVVAAEPLDQLDLAAPHASLARFTRAPDGNPWRRLLIGSKGPFAVVLAGHHGSLGHAVNAGEIRTTHSSPAMTSPARRGYWPPGAVATGAAQHFRVNGVSCGR